MSEEYRLQRFDHRTILLEDLAAGERARMSKRAIDMLTNDKDVNYYSMVDRIQRQYFHNIAHELLVLEESGGDIGDIGDLADHLMETHPALWCAMQTQIIVSLLVRLEIPF